MIKFTKKSLWNSYGNIALNFKGNKIEWKLKFSE